LENNPVRNPPPTDKTQVWIDRLNLTNSSGQVHPKKLSHPALISPINHSLKSLFNDSLSLFYVRYRPSAQAESAGGASFDAKGNLLPLANITFAANLHIDLTRLGVFPNPNAGL
jgi:hypothetical protein